MSDDVTARILVVLEKLESGQEQLRNGLEQFSADLITRIERLESGLEQLSAELTRTRADLMARMDRLEGKFTAQREGEVVNLGISERAERIAKGAQDEVRIMGEQVNAMFRQIRRLEAEVRQLRGED
jgi:uncharacterized protein (UPF0335 family)